MTYMCTTYFFGIDFLKVSAYCHYTTFHVFGGQLGHVHVAVMSHEDRHWRKLYIKPRYGTHARIIKILD